MRNIVGKPVTGENFFDREREVEDFWVLFVDHHLLVRAPRRVGKTSFLRRIEALAPGRSCGAIYVSAAAWKDEFAFAKGLFAACARKDEAVWAAARKRLFKGALKQVESVKLSQVEVAFRAWPAEDWAALVEELLGLLEETGKTWILMVDELPVLLNELGDPAAGGDPLRIRRFLNWFKSCRERADDAGGHVRWVLAGSAGLDAFTQRLQLGATVGDLLLFPLDALPEGRALELLASLARTRGLAIPEATAGHLIDRIGWPIPYYVQLVVHQLAELYPRRGGTRTPIQVDNAAVDEAFAALSRPTSRLYFDPWYQRLTEELGRPHDVWARALLTASALDPDGAARPTLQGVLGRLVQDAGEREEALSWLLAVLEGDGYLVRDEGTGRYRFRSPLLREYWVRRVS